MAQASLLRRLLQGAKSPTSAAMLAAKGGHSHTQLASADGLAFDFMVGVQASLVERDKTARMRASVEKALQRNLSLLEEGALLDVNTPRDGHCLFHALVKGGLIDTTSITCALTVPELRKIALAQASPEDIEVAAAGTGEEGMEVAEYVSAMGESLWGDHLIISSLAKVFGKDITIIGTDTARTFGAAGTEVQGALLDAVWISHHPELHYYGVVRAGSDPSGGQQPSQANKRRRLKYKTTSDGNAYSTGVGPATAASLANVPAEQGPWPTEGANAMPDKNTRSLKKAAPAMVAAGGGAGDNRRICGNCGCRGHQAVTCLQPCFACGGDHKYFQCDSPDMHHEALRQANRNRVKWQGFRAKASVSKTAGSKDSGQSGIGRYWVRQAYDPEYTSEREKSPKRKVLDKVHHVSDRCKVSLRTLWDQTEPMIMNALIDGGFLTDHCLGKDGKDAECKGILCVQHYAKEGRVDRKLCCTGVPEKERHRLHWLTGSVFQGHYRLDAHDVVGLLQCFGAGKSVEVTAQDTGLHRNTVGPLLDRLRMTATLVAEEQR